MRTYRRLLAFVRPYAWRLAAAMCCMAVFSAATSGIAFLVKPALDHIFVTKQVHMLNLIPLALVALFAIKGLANYGQSYLMSYVGQRVVADIRERLYHHLQGLSVAFFSRHPTGLLMSRILNDVGMLQSVVSDVVTSLLRDVFTMAGLMAVLFIRNWKLAIIAMVVFPAATFPIVRISKRLRRFTHKTQRKIGDISSFLQETISGCRIIKAFGMEDYERQRFSRYNDDYFRLLMRRVRLRALSSPLVEMWGGLGGAVILWYGGHAVIEGSMTTGDFFSFMTALMMMYTPVRGITRANNRVQEGLAAASRVFQVLDTPPEVQEAPNAKQLPPFREAIELRNVGFRYGDRWVLRGLNLTVRRGERLALVGPSGAGKTTLVNLIPRFYDVQEGAVLIDGHDVRSVTLRSLRSQIALVTQQTVLFNDTVRNNIAYGSPQRGEDEIVEAARRAHAHEFIMRLPQGYDTVIGEQGTRLSGGERQRIAIARAFLKDAPILILDEATSELDAASEQEVQRGLEELMRGRTVIIVAHRLTTVRNADRIAVLSGGRIVEEGTHEELMRRGGEYRRLYELQFRDAVAV